MLMSLINRADTSHPPLRRGETPLGLDGPEPFVHHAAGKSAGRGATFIPTGCDKPRIALLAQRPAFDRSDPLSQIFQVRATNAAINNWRKNR